MGAGGCYSRDRSHRKLIEKGADAKRHRRKVALFDAQFMKIWQPGSCDPRLLTPGTGAMLYRQLLTGRE